MQQRLGRTIGHLKLLAVLWLLAGLILQVNAQFGSPISVEVKNLTTEDSTRFEAEFRFKAPKNIHIYTREDQFLKLVDEKSAGLGKAELLLPTLKDYTDLDGSKLKVIESGGMIKVRRPFAGKPGEKWHFRGYLQYQGCSETTCFPPAKAVFDFSGTIPASAAAAPATGSEKPSVVTSAEEPSDKGFWLMLLGAFGAGLLLSLTPCVYPMIGITIAVIGGKDASKKQTIIRTFFYVLGLSLVYAAIGVAVASLGSAAASFFRSAWVLVPIGAIFVVLGLSMFDVIMIQTPSFISSRASKVKGNSVLGVFLLGAVSAFVVGPCVSGPVIGLISFVATSGDRLTGFALFFALAWGMGLILFVAGTASSALPKAGAWMEKVKHILGVVLIWAAFYFTRPLIGEMVFAAANIVAVALGLRALGVLDFPSFANRVKQTAIFVIGVTVLGTSIFFLLPEIKEEKKPHKYELAEVLKSEKPVLLDFTAPWCSICKEIEKTTLKEKEVLDALTKYEFIKIDYDLHPELVKRYDLVGPPAFVFLNKDGSVNGEIIVTGEKLKERLLQ